MRNHPVASRGGVHQTVAAPIQFKSGSKSIQIGFTNQRLSPHAGSATFWGWLTTTAWLSTLRAALPHPEPTSNNHLLPWEKALAFMHGLLCDARKLTHVAYHRRDPLVPELLAIRRVASQSTLSRFFQGFRSAAVNLRCFRPLWQWGVARLPSRAEGYTLDLDSTRLLHEDGHQEGVAVGFTKRGLKPCLHPLLAVLAEARLVVQLWLRGGKKLLEVPGYHFQALVTSLPASVSPLAVWRDYNGRADCENVIKELQQGFAMPTLCLHSFWATEAALSLAALTYNLTVLFQRHLGWQQKVTVQSLRYWLFVTAGVLSHPAGRTTVKLAVPPRERAWWQRLWGKILSPIPNCHAVENRPAFSG